MLQAFFCRYRYLSEASYSAILLPTFVAMVYNNEEVKRALADEIDLKLVSEFVSRYIDKTTDDGVEQEGKKEEGKKEEGKRKPEGKKEEGKKEEGKKEEIKRDSEGKKEIERRKEESSLLSSKKPLDTIDKSTEQSADLCYHPLDEFDLSRRFSPALLREVLAELSAAKVKRPLL